MYQSNTLDRTAQGALRQERKQGKLAGGSFITEVQVVVSLTAKTVAWLLNLLAVQVSEGQEQGSSTSLQKAHRETGTGWH